MNGEAMFFWQPNLEGNEVEEPHSGRNDAISWKMSQSWKSAETEIHPPDEIELGTCILENQLDKVLVE